MSIRGQFKGGFCVTRKGLLEPFKIGNILRETSNLRGYKGENIHEKGSNRYGKMV